MQGSHNPGPSHVIHCFHSHWQHRLQNWALKMSPPMACPLSLRVTMIFPGHSVAPARPSLVLGTLDLRFLWRRRQKQPPASPLNTATASYVACPAPCPFPGLRFPVPKMKFQPAPKHSMENSGRRVEPSFTSGVCECACVCVPFSLQLCFKNLVTLRRGPLLKVDFSLARRSFASRTISTVFGRI